MPVPKRFRRLLLNAATALSLALALTVAVLWVRSEIIIQDELLWNARTPAERRTSRAILKSRLGQVQWIRAQRVFARQADFEYEDPANTSNGLAARSTLPMHPGLHFVSRRFPRHPVTGTFWQRRGFSLRWPAADAPPARVRPVHVHLRLGGRPALAPPADAFAPPGHPPRPPPADPAPNPSRPLPDLRLRPPRHARPVSRVRYNPAAMRPPPILVSAATAVSLALCAAVAGLWVHSHRSPGAVRTFDRPAGRYTLLADRGRLHLRGPPVVPPAELAAAFERLDGLGNTTIQWVLTGGATEMIPFPGNAIRFRGQTLADRAALLAALDDPDRFVLAHVALCEAWPAPRPGRWVRAPDGHPEWDHHGLRVRTPAFDAADAASERVKPARIISSNDWSADPAQRRALRDRWADRLAQPLGSVPLWPAAVAFALPPIAWAAARARRARRRRAGLCPACGYDLRASPGRCPECGRPATIASPVTPDPRG